MHGPPSATTATTSDGVDIAVFDFGGDGPDVVFAHATGFHSHVWIPIIERLRDRFRCIAFDERGHGDSSSPPDGNFDWDAFAQDALAVVDTLGLDRPMAVGHSCGGALLLLAEEFRPGTFSSIYCFEPVVLPFDDPIVGTPENPLAIGARRRRQVFPSREVAYANYASTPPLDTIHPDALRAYVEHGFEEAPDGSVLLKCSGEDEAATYMGALAHSAFGQLGDVTCPVTLACGTRTVAIGLPILERLAERLPRARTEAFDDLGHFGPLEDPAAVAESIAKAFAEG